MSRQVSDFVLSVVYDSDLNCMSFIALNNDVAICQTDAHIFLNKLIEEAKK